MPASLRTQLEAALRPAYEVERELGGGGMSRVYVAMETGLGRRVVIKVLSPQLTAGISAERFAREIQLSARLQQANIVPVLASGRLPVHDVEEVDGTAARLEDGLPYYTMPFIDGPSLRARLVAGRLPTADAISILRDIARALAFAHEHGVVHRDIKPDNVLLSGETAVVVDFGIAKALSAARGESPSGRKEPPSGEALTERGTSLGTPAYMAPEQVAGEDTMDYRVDIYAWGMLAYEMLAGRHPFAGKSTSQLLAAQIAEVPPALEAADAPPAVSDLVRRCVSKSPGDRPQHATDLLRALDAATPRRLGRGLRYGLLVGFALAALARVTAVLLRPTTYAAGRTVQITASQDLEVDAAISPDGRFVAYAGGPPNLLRIYVRSLASGRSVMVAPDSGPAQRWPRWSPSGSRLLFAQRGGVFDVPALGGETRRLFETDSAFLRANPTAAMSPDGAAIAYGDTLGIELRPMAGGPPRLLVAGAELHSPAWSPDIRRLAYVAGNSQYVNVIGNTAPSAIWTVSLEGGPPVRVTADTYLDTSPVWTPDGRGLFYVSNADGERDVYYIALRPNGTAIGGPTRLTTGLAPYTISLSGDGSQMVYSVLHLRSNIWQAPISSSGMTRSGQATQITRENQRVEGVDLSHDGKSILYDANRFGNADIFRLSLAGGDPVQLTTDSADDFEPVWSPDDRSIAFYSSRTGNRDLYVMDVDGRSVERVTSLPTAERFPTWSPDGRRLAFASTAGGSREDLYVTTRSAAGQWSAPVRLTTFGAAYPRWSPDGRWIAAISRGRLVLVPGDSAGPPVTLVAPPPNATIVFANWGPDPRTVYYQSIDFSTGHWAIWSVPVSGGAPRELVGFDKGTGGVAFCTDGRRVFFTISSDDSDIWTMRLVRR
jgi:Tol biopolymer transport system component/tRNA A-37 threonylcarbamoyl transferase component Bud32